MNRNLFEAARQRMLAELCDWIARGADLAEIEDEIKGTDSAMRQIAALGTRSRPP